MTKVTFPAVKEDGRYKTLTLANDGTAHKTTLRGFKRNVTEPVDLTGATFTVTDDNTGYRGQRHVISITIKFPDGREEYHSTTLKGFVARATYREIQEWVASRRH